MTNSLSVLLHVFKYTILPGKSPLIESLNSSYNATVDDDDDNNNTNTNTNNNTVTISMSVVHNSYSSSKHGL
jgi:hypothetical protein